ncbi:putative lipid II flippase FtsW [Aliiroseovarius crassostreae]|uniref:putative lipid II flippase FtsW n=1 Tax=Aliiroseovarius crassostreae TaxID=154981 RepID=UPI003C7C6CA8
MTEMVYGAIPKADGDPILPRWWRTVDRWSISCVLVLFGLGILLGLAASPPLAERNGLDYFHYVERQLLFGTTALVTLFATTMLSPTMVRRLGVIGFALAFVAVVMLPVLGTDFGKGAVRWYSLGFASFQPSEFLKPGFVIVAAWLMAASHELNGPPGKAMSLGLLVVIAAFLVMQPDYGQTALIAFSWGVMYFLAGAPIFVLVSLVGLVIFGMTVAYNNSEHVARRIDGFLNPEVDPTTQLGYATNAIREGGFFGVGVGEGQVKWSLPDAHTDFIIAVAAEEYGLILVLVIILLYATIVVRSFMRLIQERDTFIRLAGAGLAAIFGVQALINMGVAVRLLPAKGMTLPFVSYGGSSLIAGGIALGMLLAFTRSRPQGRMQDVFTQRH